MDDGNGPYYSESLPDLIGYGSGTLPQSQYLSETSGLFELTTYYTDANASSQLGDTINGVLQSGGVKGYVYQTAVAQGEAKADFSKIGQPNGPVLLLTNAYFAHWDGTATTYQQAKGLNANIVYPVASTTTYSKRLAEHVLCGRVGWGSSAEIVSA